MGLKEHWQEYFEDLSKKCTDEEWCEQYRKLVSFLTQQKLQSVLPSVQDIKMETLQRVSRLRPAAEDDRAKLVRMRLLGEDKIYVNEYNACRERVEARERCRLRREEARRLCSSTKESASTS